MISSVRSRDREGSPGNSLGTWAVCIEILDQNIRRGSIGDRAS